MKKSNEPTKIIIHGHFYQPPRENANSNIIDIQESATPYNNWNENIFHCCYKTNAYSRYLDYSGRIISINNNYESMSCNFGPTLLRWIEENHINTYHKIIEADRNSVLKYGHGNMIAQVYNHTILPLDSKQNAKLQIKWALNDFKRRFNRDSEGIWLAETAIHPSLIDLLYENNIKFVILSPFQASSYIDENGTEVELNGEPIPYDKPYFIEGENHKITAFFYNGELASNISFGHMLRDADLMYDKLLEIKTKDGCDLLHTATDGEIYGHHESFGDMAYCALVKKIESNKDFEITNYATYLDNCEITHTAKLSLGQDKKGSSWSCYHGVLRWEENCGCHTGGPANWNQKWRRPLRDALDLVRDFVDSKIKELKLNDEILENLDLVLSNSMDMASYLNHFANAYNKDRYKEIAKALTALAFSSYSYTSCGWFFNDISGIEPVKNIDFAYQAINLYKDESLEKDFLNVLEKAISNIDGKTGKEIALSTRSRTTIEEEAGIYFTVIKSLESKNIDQYGYIKLLSFKQEGETSKLSLYHTYLLTTCELKIKLSRMNKDFIANVNNKYISFNKDLKLKKFSFDAKRVLEANLNHLDLDIIKHRAKLLTALSTVDSLILEDRQFYTQLATYTLDSLFRARRKIEWKEFNKATNTLLHTLKQSASKVNKESINYMLEKHIRKLALEIVETDLTMTKIEQVLDFVRICRNNGFEPKLTNLQDEIYPRLNTLSKTKSKYKEDLLKELNFSF